MRAAVRCPIAAYARIISQKSEVRSQKSEKNLKIKTQNTTLVINGLVGSLDGKTLIKGSKKGRPEDAESLGNKLAETLLSKGAGEILAEFYGTHP